MTVALVANIARPISSAISTAFSADSYGLLSSYGLLGASASPDAVIEALFANNEVGAWYDPSDLTTMFQDSVGTTPVTADGQPVGLILDKSKGLVLGSECMPQPITSSTTGLWTVVAGVIYRNGSSNGIVVCPTLGNIPLSSGKTYRVTFTISNFSGDSFYFRIGGSAAIQVAANGFFTATGVGGNSDSINFAPWAGLAGEATISGLTVKEVPGNHGIQSTAASRPLYKTDGTYHWLQFDGVDDSLSTAAIDFTSTDKMSAFTGFRYSESGPRRPFATTPQGVEFRISYTGVGQFDMSHNLSGPESEGGMRSNPTTFPQNTRTVFSTVIDGSGTTWGTETPVGRVNGTQVMYDAFGDTNQTGNFPSATLSMSHGGNCPCYFYSLIVRGALSTTQEITDTETWVNSKTGAY